MAPGSRPDSKLNLNLSGMSPVSEIPTSASSKSPFGEPKRTNGLAGLNNARVGAGSPLHESGSRLFPKRTRELQAQTGMSPSIWGPPTSGTSTPLYEIPESPSQDGFPDLVPVTESGINSPARRGRAGTLPSRISPVGTINGISVSSLTSKTSRPTPSTSPFKPPVSQLSESSNYGQTHSSSSAALLSRLRAGSAGSVASRSSYLGSSSLLGQSVFAPNWNTRDRVNTLTSIKSAEDPSSPTHSNYSREGLTDENVRTLDYLGLAETPHQNQSLAFHGAIGQQQSNLMSDLLSNLDQRGGNRFRSYSVNAPQKYASERDQEAFAAMSNYASGTSTPSAIAAEYAAMQERIQQHNKQVQAFASKTSSARPRAMTETPQRASFRSFPKASSPAPDLGQTQMNGESDQYGLNGSLQQLSLETGSSNPQNDQYDDMGGSQVSRSLWIGSIPVSTTPSSLDAIFSNYGSVESTRVLTHKNCGFVNFENVENAVHARQVLNNKEIFPGAGPVRIGFAKAPSNSITPAYGTMPPSPTQNLSQLGGEASVRSNVSQAHHSTASTPQGLDLPSEIMHIVSEFGATDQEMSAISASIQSSFSYQNFQPEIPPIAEPSQTRMYDAPRLRDIRKRIDNNACGLQEIEELANNMLPEIAELSSDYLGNTVVQKLFEFCSEQTKEAMLAQIAPHLAEIGIHKNGTWAAQKIIEVCKLDSQMSMIVNYLRPYTVPLFLDQYGNYVLQGCLRFGSPYNDFIFETMLTQLYDIAQGRFGARAMRACLEAHHSTKHQQRMMAAAIAMNSVQLATNANGALLLTWYLDTCTFPGRRGVLAPRLVPHLVHLCTHKVAYLTVLKVINQRNEPEARDMVLKALFFSENDEVLEKILRDQTSGATLIFKVLTTPVFEESMRNDLVQNVAKVLTRIKAQPNQGYKRLMDEVGLSSRSTHTPVHNSQNHTHPGGFERSRPGSQQNNGFPTPQNVQRPFNSGFMPGMQGQAYENSQSPVRTGSADSLSFPSYGYGQAQPQYNQMPQQVSPHQLQYQNYMGGPQRNNYNQMPATAYPGYATPPPSVETLRGVNPGSPFAGYGQMSPVMGNAGFGGQQYMQQPQYGFQQQNFFPQQMQAVNGGGRRGRRAPYQAY
jgi:protein JSN1